MAQPIGESPFSTQSIIEAPKNPHTGNEGFLLGMPDEAAALLDNVIVLPIAEELQQQVDLRSETYLAPTIVHPRQIAAIGGAKVKYTVEEPAIHEDVKHSAAILLSHGILGKEVIYEDFRHDMAQLGWQVISYDPPRSVGMRGYHPAHLLHPERLLSQAAYGVMRAAREQFGIERFINVPHSMGGLTIKTLNEFLGDEAAELIDAQVQVDPVGLNKEPVAIRAGRFICMIARQAPGYAGCQSPRQAMRIAANEIGYVVRNPKRFIGELLTAQQCQSAESIIQARALGIRTAAIAMEHSGIFPAYDVARQSDDLFDIFDIYPGDHLVQQKDSKNFAKFVDELLDELLQPFASV